MLASVFLPGPLFVAFVVLTALGGGLSVLALLSHRGLPADPASRNAQTLAGVLGVLWIAGFTYLSLTQGAFIALLNLLPIWVLRRLRGSAT
jgi:hypothetical protein